MNKPDVLPMLPGQPGKSGRVAAAPKALIHQPAPMNAASHQAAIAPTHPVQHRDASAYVDPYLFETGYYTRRAEPEELARAAASRIQLRADAENARPKRRTA